MDKLMLARMLSPVIMQALNKAPTLMTNLEDSGSEDMLPNVITALKNQQDPMIMEEMLTKPRIDTSGNIWPPMSATDLDYKYNQEIDSVDPQSWFYRTLYENSGYGPKVTDFEIQGNSWGLPLDLANPESENALAVFSGSEFENPKKELFKKLMSGGK